MGPNVKILMGQSFGSWTHGHGPMTWAQLALGPCVQEPKLGPMSILTFGSISILSMPDF